MHIDVDDNFDDEDDGIQSCFFPLSPAPVPAVKHLHLGKVRRAILQDLGDTKVSWSVMANVRSMDWWENLKRTLPDIFHEKIPMLSGESMFP